jgi:hypothetical protein
MTDSYEAAHTRLILECLATAHTRLRMLNAGKLKPLSNSVSQAAADQSYLDTVHKLAEGLSKAMVSHEKSDTAEKLLAARLWKQCAIATESRDAAPRVP